MGEMTKNLVLIVALFCLILCVGINVYAADTRPCADDISKFCKDVKPGGGRIASCLKEHEKDLSPACKTRTEEMMMRAREIHKACADDIDKFCSDAQPGKGHMARCLREHKDELSPECREEQRKIQRKMD
jgi:hypothetical protein